MTIRVRSFDADGCLFNREYFPNKDVIAANRTLLDAIKKEQQEGDKNIVFVGSNRQAARTDQKNMAVKGSGSAFNAVEAVANEIGGTLDPLLLADIYAKLEIGTSFKKAQEANYGPETDIPVDSKEHANWLFDENKASILYAQMHKIASENPEEEIIFDFYDDTGSILYQLETLYSKCPNLIPSNVTLRLNHYAGEDSCQNKAEIKGEGMINKNYAQTVINMSERAKAHKPGSDGIKEKLDIASAIKPTKSDEFFHEQLKIIEQKAKDFEKHGKVGAIEAKQLHADLSDAYNQFRNDFDIKSFKESCNTAMEKARPKLEINRGWKEVLVNTAAAVFSLGIGYLAAGLIKAAVTRNIDNFVLFKTKTDSIKTMDKIDKAVNAIADYDESKLKP